MAKRGRVLSHCTKSCMFVSSTSLIKWSAVVAGCLLLQQQHSVPVEGSLTRQAEETNDESYNSLRLDKRQDSRITSSTDVILSTSEPEESDGQRFLSALGSYWYVLLVILVILVVVFVFLCACIVRKRRRSHHSLRIEMGRHGYSRSPESNHSTRQLSSTDTHSAPQHTNSSVIDLASSPGSMSIDPTPIPSPQPSFASSSQRSHRSSGNKRRRNLSPGHTSSGSEETIKAYETRSVSSLGLGAANTSVAYAHPRIPRAESVNSGERRRSHSSRSHRGHRRTTSNPQVKVTPLLDNGSLYSSPSVVSMVSAASSNRSNRSSRSSRSGRSNRSHSDSSSTVVEVDVKVHLSKEQEREARTEIAAALAESARQLAQSAANFGQEEEEPMWHSQSLPYHISPPHRISVGTTNSLPTATVPSKRQLFPSHSSSTLTSNRELYGNRPSLPRAIPTASLDRPRNTASLDRPSHYERPRWDSIGRRSQPESPLTFSISSPSQKSFASNYEYAPGNYPSSQVHLSRSPHYLRNYHSSSTVGEPGLEMPHSQSQVSLDYVHNPEVSDQFQYQNGHYPPPVAATAGPPESLLLQSSSSVSLDFKHHKSKLPNGMTTTMSYPSNLPSRLEELRSKLDSELELKTSTESESNSSTLRASSHSDNRDRLSRLSEKSEQMDSDNEDVTSGHVDVESELEKRSGQLSMAPDTQPNHIQQTNVREPSISRETNQSQAETSCLNTSELAQNGTSQSNTTMTHTEVVSLDSSPSSQSTQSVNDTSTLTKTTTNTHTLTQHNSLPDVSSQSHHQLDASQNSATPSLHRSSSGPSIEDEEEEQVSSIASGYAATGSASSLDTTNAKENNGPPKPATSELNKTLESQFSYPLRKLLDESFSYDVDDDENYASLDKSLMVPVGQNRHRNDKYHHRNHRHRDCHASNRFHGNVTREMPGSSYMNGTQNNHGYNQPRTGLTERVRYNHSSHHESITIDV